MTDTNTKELEAARDAIVQLHADANRKGRHAPQRMWEAALTLIDSALSAQPAGTSSSLHAALYTPPSPVQALGAALSRRNWHETEVAYARIRDMEHRYPASPMPPAGEGKGAGLTDAERNLVETTRRKLAQGRATGPEEHMLRIIDRLAPETPADGGEA